MTADLLRISNEKVDAVASMAVPAVSSWNLGVQPGYIADDLVPLTMDMLAPTIGCGHYWSLPAKMADGILGVALRELFPVRRKHAHSMRCGYKVY